jgi:hypothetical protein
MRKLLQKRRIRFSLTRSRFSRRGRDAGVDRGAAWRKRPQRLSCVGAGSVSGPPVRVSLPGGHHGGQEGLEAAGGLLGRRRTPPDGLEGIGRLRPLPEPKVCAGCAQVLWTPVYVIGYMLAILGRAKVMIIKQLAALAVLALTLSGCAPLPIGTAAGGATALVVTDPHWCREHRYYRYDLEWHLHHCGGWCTQSGCGH